MNETALHHRVTDRAAELVAYKPQLLIVFFGRRL